MVAQTADWRLRRRKDKYAAPISSKRGGGLLALSIGCNALIRSWLVVGHVPLKVRF